MDQTPLKKISFKDIFGLSPHMVSLGEKDDAEILRFFDNAAMEGKGFKLLMQRKPHFFDLYRQRGSQNMIVGLRDTTRALVGVGTMASTPCFVAGKPAHFAYLCDLRVNCPDPNIRKEWKSIFNLFVRDGVKMVEAGENPYLITAVIDGNERAKKFLEKSHDGNRLLSVAPYAMVSLIAKIPFLKFKPNSYSVERGHEGLVDEIENFLQSVHKDQAFGQNFGSPHFELRRRLKEWKGFSAHDFFVARSPAGKIVGVTALWNPNHCKQTIVEGPWWTKVYNFLASPFPLPQFGKPLEFVYLTHLSFDWGLTVDERHQVFASLVDALWPEKRKRKAHALAFCDFTEWSLKPAVKAYLQADTKVRMYIALPEASAATFKREDLGRFPPAFEMSLV